MNISKASRERLKVCLKEREEIESRLHQKDKEIRQIKEEILKEEDYTN